MTKKDDGPKLILTVTPRGLAPFEAIDAEILQGLAIGTKLEVRRTETPRSKALGRWWQLMGAVAKATDDRWFSSRAVSNEFLLRFGCVDAEALTANGEKRIPMSLKEFSEEQLRRLCLQAEFVISTEVLPGIEIDDLIKGTRSQT